MEWEEADARLCMSWGDRQLPPPQERGLQPGEGCLLRHPHAGHVRPIPWHPGTGGERLEGIPSKRRFRQWTNTDATKQTMEDYEETVAGVAPTLLALR